MNNPNQWLADGGRKPRCRVGFVEGALFSLAILLLAAAGSAEAATAIGKVTRLQGECVGLFEGKTTPLAEGAAIHLDETITTGADARLELTFEDETKLTIGEKASVKIDAFVYQPRGLGNRFGAAITGPFRYVSGKLMKTSASSAEVETPFATIGIRGTDIWGGPVDGKSGVFLFEGAATVTNNAGAAALDTPGEGVDIETAAPPGPVTNWPREKIDRAIATVTFR